MRKAILLLILIVFWGASCETTKDMSHIDFDGIPTVVYQMKKDYSALVPVILDDSKTKVVSYPSPKDMFHPNGELRAQQQLSDDFYLDQIGLTINSAFISYTIEHYSHIIMPPSPDSLFKLIVDSDPFKKMYNLGNRKQYLEEGKVESIVSSGDYKHYKKLK